MQTLNHDGVVAIRGLSPRSSGAAAEGRGQLGTAAQHGIHRGTAGADRLMQVGAVLVQVADQGADFAGGVETLDRLAVPVENLTLDVAARTAGASRHGRHFLDRVERALLDLRHRGDVAAEIGVFTGIDHRVELIHLSAQHRRILADLLGQLLDGVRLDDPALFQLDGVVVGPVIRVAAGHRPADPGIDQRLRLEAVVVHNHMNRLLTGDRHIDVLAVLVVLHVLALIGLRLVVITGAVGGDFHPRAVLHIELTNERRLKLRNLDAMEVAAGHGLAVHMPELSAQRHLHLHAVARDVRGARVVDAVAAVELAVHIHIALVAAGGQQNALARLGVDHGAVRLLHADALHLLGDGVLHEADHLMLVERLRAAITGSLVKAVPAAAVLEGEAAVLVAEVTRRADEVRARQIREFDQQGAPAQRAAAGVADFVIDRLENRLNPRQIRRELIGQPVEILFRNDMRLVHRAHVGTPGLQIVGVNEDDALAGGNRLTARVLLVGLIVNHSVNVVVDFVSLDISRRARHAVAADDDIVLLVPLHVLAVQNPLAGIFVNRLFLFRFRVEHAGAEQTNARSAHRGRFQELLTGNVLRHVNPSFLTCVCRTCEGGAAHGCPASLL